MDQTELLDFLLNVVEAQHLSYAIAGSHASMAFGEARFTNDIDVVVGLAPATLRQFCGAFPFPEFYVSEDGAREEGKSEKHLRDIAGSLKTMGGRIDRQYIDEWAPRLNVGHVWTEVVRRFPGSESRPER